MGDKGKKDKDKKAKQTNIKKGAKREAKKRKQQKQQIKRYWLRNIPISISYNQYLSFLSFQKQIKFRIDSERLRFKQVYHKPLP